MSRPCPWCEVNLDKEFVRSLTKISEPCPACKKPLRQSMYQVLFIVVLLLPLIAGILYLSKVAYDAGSQNGAIFILFIGVAVGAFLQKYIPVVYAPAKGFSSNST